MTFEELLKHTVEQGASDLHITVNSPPVIRRNGRLVRIGDTRMTPADILQFVRCMLRDDQLEIFEEKGEIDLSFSKGGIGRFRVNAFKQRGSCSIVARLIKSDIPTIESLGLPDVVRDLSKKTKGLILVTGPTGSGKSTTLATLINAINTERDCHILTLEDPIEFVHEHKMSIVNQREIGNDSKSYADALRAALREDPDVILVGEMRDLETISIAVTAAETGHLVLSTLHTVGAAKTIDRIIDVFPTYQQQQIRLQLSMVLQGVVSQQLIPRVDKPGRAAAIEVMLVNPAIRNLIREGKTFQINSVIQTNSRIGMQAMDNSLVNLYRKGCISQEDALSHAAEQDNIARLLNVL